MRCRTYTPRDTIGGKENEIDGRIPDAKWETVASLMYMSSLLIRLRKLRWI